MKKIEFAYYLLAGYCLYATYSMDPKIPVDIYSISGLFLGALSPLIAIVDHGGFDGWLVALFILVSPFLGCVLCADFQRYRWGHMCLILTALCASKVGTGTYMNPIVGIGGLFAIVVIGVMFAKAGAEVAVGEAKKVLGIDEKINNKVKQR